MAKDKKTFILYTDMIHTVKKLPMELRGELLTIILEYVNDENPKIEDNLLLEIAFEPIKLQLKRDLIKWDEFVKRQSENGKKNGQKAKKANPEPKKPTPNLVNLNDNVNVTVSDTVNENEIKEKDVASQLSDYQLCTDFWLLQFHPGFKFTGQQGKALKSIISKIASTAKAAGNDLSPVMIVDTFKMICQRLPEWYKGKDLSTIDSKFNEIIYEIKNNPNGRKQPNSKPISIFSPLYSPGVGVVQSDIPG